LAIVSLRALEWVSGGQDDKIAQNFSKFVQKFVIFA
jgi:hypothetical protein